MKRPAPCPWCGSVAVMAEGTDTRVAMVCQKCLCHGPEVRSALGRPGALRAWNKRKPPNSANRSAETGGQDRPKAQPSKQSLVFPCASNPVKRPRRKRR